MTSHGYTETQRSQPFGDVLLAKVPLQLGDAGVRVVENRRGERRVGVAPREYLAEMLEASRAAGRDHRDVHGVGDRGGHLTVKPGPSAVAIHRCEQDFAGAAR